MGRINFNDFQYIDAKLSDFPFSKVGLFNSTGGYVAGTVTGLTPYINNKITLAHYDDPNTRNNGTGFCVTDTEITEGTNPDTGAMGGLVPIRYRRLDLLVTPYIAHSPVYYYEYTTLREYIGTGAVAALARAFATELYPAPDITGRGSMGVAVRSNSTMEIGQQINPANQFTLDEIGDWIIITKFELYDSENLPRTRQANGIYPTLFYDGGAAFYYAGNNNQRYTVGGLQIVFPFNPVDVAINPMQGTQYLSAYNDINTTIRICDSLKGLASYRSGEGEFITSPYEQSGINGAMLIAIFAQLPNITYSMQTSGAVGFVVGSGGLICANGRTTTGWTSQHLIFQNTETFEKICADFGIIASNNMDDVLNTPIDFFPDNGGVVPDGGNSTGFPTNPTPSIPNFPDNTTDIIPEQPANVSALSAVGVYALNVAQAKSFLNWLMTDDFINNISNLFNDKLSAVGDLKILPFDIAKHDNTHALLSNELVVGNVAGAIQNYRITDGYNTWLNGGEYTYTAYYGDFNDYDRCSYSLYIPYAGIVDMDAGDVVNKKLRLAYAVDLLTGNATAFVYSNGVLVKTVSASMGISVPITSTNANQRQLNSTLTMMSAANNIFSGGISSVLSGNPMPLFSSVTGAMTSVVENAMQNPLVTQHTGGFGSSTGLSMPQSAFLIITRQVIAIPTDYKSNVGIPATYRGKISEFVGSGFVSISASKIDVDCTQQERDMILAALSSGIYL